MGLRGPAPKPTVLKILQGNPGGKGLNRREPKPESVPIECPPPPQYLKDAAKAEWCRLWPQLKACGLLTTADMKLFESYCETWAWYLELNKECKRLGTYVEFPGEKTNKGKPRATAFGLAPWWTARNQALDKVIKIAGELGMSPAARSRIQMFEEHEQKDDLRKRLLG